MLGVKTKKRIVLTGGHAGATAFVLVDEIRIQKKPWQVYWIGPKSSFEGRYVPTLASMYFPRYGIRSFEIFSGRIQRKFSPWTIPSLAKIPLGFVHAFLLLLKLKPDIILSLGGFSAFPVVFAGFLLGIPVLIHEQTATAGRANIFSAHFAKKIFISRETSKKYFPREKLVLTGNPVPKDIVKNKIQNELPKFPVIFVTGGQSGSFTINEELEKVLEVLLKKFSIIHLTGLVQEEKFKRIRENLNKNLKRRYKVFGIVDPKIFNKFFNQAHIVISRAGANTVSKIVVAKKASILIPIPFSFLGEQQKNALFAKKFAHARVIRQDLFTSARLLKELEYLVRNWRKISRDVSWKKNPDLSAAETIVGEIEKNLK